MGDQAFSKSTSFRPCFNTVFGRPGLCLIYFIRRSFEPRLFLVREEHESKAMRRRDDSVPVLGLGKAIVQHIDYRNEILYRQFKSIGT